MPDKFDRFMRATKEFFQRGKENPQTFNSRNVDTFLSKWDKPERPSVLPASSLSLPDVEKVFHLKKDPRYDDIWDLREEDLIPVPEALHKRLADISSTLGQDPNNEASCRLRLDAILLDCIIAERELLRSPFNSGVIRDDDKPISLTLENNLSLQIEYKGTQRTLQGRSDYAVWYDASDDTATNLVVLEAKNLAGAGLAQCLCYMAMVHAIRKQEHKKNQIVFGCFSDGYRFTFLRIDNESRWSEWPCSPWGTIHKKRESIIYTHMRLIIRSAVRTSPRSSPERVSAQTDHRPHARPYYELRIRSSSDEQPMMDDGW
ncbi:hypothetical protein DTO282E5_2167 [Paecilomyces variotii]|nr:hypothetical protein DTO282E5_2167 [Paecilomyces variotii]